MCDATTHTSPKYLCSYHSELKMFLDRKQGASKISDASKYLPRKNAPVVALSEPNRDFVVMRAASTLLEELWDGKLRGTLMSFVAKVCEDFSSKKRLITTLKREKGRERALTRHETTVSLPMPPFLTAKMKHPKWTRWKDHDSMKYILDVLISSQEKLQHLLEIEKNVTNELQQMQDEGIYPAPELQTIRREAKMYKETHEQGSDKKFGGDLESYRERDQAIDGGLHLAERKLSLLGRRLYEERRNKEMARKKESRKKKAKKNYDYMYLGERGNTCKSVRTITHGRHIPDVPCGKITIEVSS